MSNSNKTTEANKATSEPVAPVAPVPAVEDNTPNGEILFTEAGKKATVTAYRAKGSTAISIVLKSRGAKAKTLHVADASRIDVRSMKAETLKEACAKAAHATGNLALFEVKEYKGRRGMIRSFYNPKTGNGYATLIRKGSKPFNFPLHRVNFKAMKSKTLDEAFNKAVWATGSVAVLPYPNATTTEAAPTQS